MMSEEDRVVHPRRMTTAQNRKRGSQYVAEETSEEDISTSSKGSMIRKRKKVSQNGKRGRERKEIDRGEEDMVIVADDEDIDKINQRRTGEVSFKLPTKTTRAEIEYQGMTAQELQQHATMALDDLEMARTKSPNIQGRISGIMKDRIQSLKGMIECLTEKLQEVRDIIYQKTRKMELSTEIKRLKKEKEIWEKEKERKDQEIEAKQMKYEELETKLWDLTRWDQNAAREEDKEKGQRKIQESQTRRKTDTQAETITNYDEEFPIYRPALRGERKRILIARSTSKRPAALDSPPVRAAALPGPSKKIAEEPRPRKEKEKEEIEEEIEELRKRIKTLMEKKRKLVGEEKGTMKRNEQEMIGKPRIVSNIQIVPPRAEAEWTKVIGRKERRENVQNNQRNKGQGENRRDIAQKKRLRNPPRTVAIGIKTRSEDVSYADIMKKAREKISLADLGIEDTKIRRGINGGIIIEIPEQEQDQGSTKANKLADKRGLKGGESEYNKTHSQRRD